MLKLSVANFEFIVLQRKALILPLQLFPISRVVYNETFISAFYGKQFAPSPTAVANERDGIFEWMNKERSHIVEQMEWETMPSTNDLKSLLCAFLSSAQMLHENCQENENVSFRRSKWTKMNLWRKSDLFYARRSNEKCVWVAALFFCVYSVVLISYFRSCLMMSNIHDDVIYFKHFRRNFHFGAPKLNQP